MDLLLFVQLSFTFFSAGVLDAVAGGGGLISLPAYLMAGLSPHAAVATNKCGGLPGVILSALRLIRRGEIQYPSVWWGLAGALMGAFGGARLNLFLSEGVLISFMLVAIPLIALLLFRKGSFGEIDCSVNKSPAQLNLLSLAAGLVVGCYDGLLGPGSGTFLILAYTLLCGFPLLTASGNSKAANAASNLMSLFTFLQAGEVVWSLGLLAAFWTLLGSYAGSTLTLRYGATIIRPMLFLVFFLLFFQLLSRIL